MSNKCLPQTIGAVPMFVGHELCWLWNWKAAYP